VKLSFDCTLALIDPLTHPPRHQPHLTFPETPSALRGFPPERSERAGAAKRVDIHALKNPAKTYKEKKGGGAGLEPITTAATTYRDGGLVLPPVPCLCQLYIENTIGTKAGFAVVPPNLPNDLACIGTKLREVASYFDAI